MRIQETIQQLEATMISKGASRFDAGLIAGHARNSMSGNRHFASGKAKRVHVRLVSGIIRRVGFTMDVHFETPSGFVVKPTRFTVWRFPRKDGTTKIQINAKPRN